MNAIDLFAGCGGLSKGFMDAGFDIIVGVDNDQDALNTFALNHNGAKPLNADLSKQETFDEIKKIAGDKTIDVIIAGPPCQGFSLTGPRNFDDERNKLYLAVIEMVKQYKPKAFIIENVPGMATLYKGQIKEEILKRFRDMGYNIDCEVLKACDYGVPQMRKRLIFMGIRKDLGEPCFPEAQFGPGTDRPYRTCREAISDLPTRHKEFREALIYRPLYKKNICKYLLSVIENSTKEHIDVSNLTIEHILPQKENAAVWKKEVGADYGRVYETYLHTLGNLTITGHNSELGTKAFEEKKKIIRQNSKANILNREVLSADTWTEKSILHRAEILADILIEEFKYIEIHSDTNESTELTFDVNSNFDFSNTKPGEMIFVGEHTKVSSWADLLAKTMNTAFDLDAETITDLATKDYSIPYATRIYISNDERKIRKPKQIDNSGIYFEANLSANGIISFIKDLLAKLQLDTDDFSFSLSEVPFDIDNEDTWAEGLIPVAKLFYNFVENLVEKELIDSAELENLKTKEYTKKLFQATDYPTIANNRTDNMGNSLQKRYRAKAINFNGSEIYVSTQFFDSDRDAVIDWYRSHL